ncbi:MAG: Clp protease N-terminal domain-containing protein, partial [Spongiibacteraceae bacterium]
MRPDRFTTSLQTALADAQSLAVGREHQFIEPLHVLSALISPRGSAARSLLEKAGAAVSALELGLNQALDRLPTVQG